MIEAAADLYMHKKMKFPVVLFDLDDTLIVDEAASREAYLGIAEAAGNLGLDSAQFARDLEHARDDDWKSNPLREFCESIGIIHTECLWADFVTPGEPWESLREWSGTFRVKIFESALRAQGIEDADAATTLAEKFKTVRWSKMRLMPGVLEVLRGIAPGRKFGLLTNGEPSFQRAKLKASGLGGFFDAVVVSGEEKIGKPSPEIFHRLLERLDAHAADAVMVGNSLARDIAGARAAGITGVWLRVPGAEETANVVPDFEIDSLGRLPGILAD